MNEPADQKKILNIYAALSVSLLMSFAPMATAAGLATLLFLGVLTAAYILRGRAGHDSLMADHMTFVIRTVWISGFMALFTMSAAVAYVLSVYDPSAILPCSDMVMASSNAADVQQGFAPCMQAFMDANLTYFINGVIIGAGPVVIYMVYRIAKGVSRAMKGFRIGDTKSWF